MGLEKLSTMYEYLRGIDSDCESHFEGSDVQDWAKECDTEWKVYLPHDPKEAGSIERKKGILKLQIKLLTKKPILAGWTKVLSQALMHSVNKKRPGMQGFSKGEGKALSPCSLQTGETQPLATN